MTILRAIERFFSIVASAFLFCIMLLVSADVFMRYALSKPFSFTYDLVATYLLVGIFFLGLSETHAWRAHVSVESLIHACPPQIQRLAAMMSNLVGIALFGAICWFTATRTMQEYTFGNVLTGEIPWPAWTSIVMAPLGSGLLTLRLLCELLLLASGKTIAEVTESPSAGSNGMVEIRGFE